MSTPKTRPEVNVEPKWQSAFRDALLTAETATGTPKLPALDGLRAIAMLMVFLYHAWEYSGKKYWVFAGIPIGDILSHCNLGVDLFIILSGFCLYWPILHRPERFVLRQWFERRFWRIAPAYYASMVFIVAAPLLANVLLRKLNMPAIAEPPLTIIQVITHLTFTHPFHPSTLFGIQGVYWSLGLEAQLYLLFPLWLKVTNRFGILTTVLAMLAIAIIWSIVWPSILPQSWHFVAEFSVLQRMFQFGLGMAIASYHHRTLKPMPMPIAIGALVLLFVSQTSLVPTSILPTSLIVGTLAIAVIVAAALTPHPLTSIMRSKPLVFLGTISYSMYLLHQRITWGLGGIVKKILHLSDAYSMAICLVIALPVVIALATLFYTFIERRFAHGWKPRHQQG